MDLVISELTTGGASRVNFSICQLWIDVWESGVGSTTAHGNYTGWLDLGLGCFQFWIWLCVLLHYVMFE